jgi:hypothetical protein
VPRSKPRTYGAYADCYPVLDAALAAGGARLPFEHLRVAYAYRHRLYRARKIVLDAALAEVRPGQVASSPYDTLYLTLEQDGEVIKRGSDPDRPAVIVFNVRGASSEMQAQMTDLEGNPIKAAPAAGHDLTETDLLAGLENLKKGLRLE